MAHIARNLMFALAAGAAGGAAASLMNRDINQKRNLAKGAIRAGLFAYDRVRGAMGEAAESMSDVLAEVRSDLEMERNTPEPEHESGDTQRATENVSPFVVKGETERKSHG